MEIYNIRKLSISGNEVTRFATTYNPYAKNKDKTLISVKTLDEMIELNKPDCDFNFMEQHSSNMALNQLLIKKSSETETSLIDINNTADVYYDTTYNIKICCDEVLNKLYYPTNAITHVTNETIFITDNIKVFDSSKISNMKFFENEISSDLNTNVSDELIILGNSIVNDKYKVNTSIFKIDDGYISPANSSELISKFYADEDLTTHIDNTYLKTWNYGDNTAYCFKENLIVYFENSVSFTYNYDACETLRSDWYDVFCSRTIINLSKPMFFNFTIPDMVKKIYTSHKLENYSFTLNYRSDIEIFAPKIKLNADGFSFKNADYSKNGITVHIDKIHGNETVLKGIHNLYITSRFFNNINIDTATYGIFGDMTNVNTVYVENNNLYTSLEGTELVNKLESILSPSKTGFVVLI